MSNMIPTPSIKDFLFDEFMEPLKISAYRLAKDIRVPYSRIQEILSGKRKVTIDTSMRLARYFQVSDTYFFNIQNDIDYRNQKIELEQVLESIEPCPACV